MAKGDSLFFSADDDEIVECDNCGVSVHEGNVRWTAAS